MLSFFRNRKAASDAGAKDVAALEEKTKLVAATFSKSGSKKTKKSVVEMERDDKRLTGAFQKLASPLGVFVRPAAVPDAYTLNDEFLVRLKEGRSFEAPETAALMAQACASVELYHRAFFSLASFGRWNVILTEAARSVAFPATLDPSLVKLVGSWPRVAIANVLARGEFLSDFSLHPRTISPHTDPAFDAAAKAQQTNAEKSDALALCRDKWCLGLLFFELVTMTKIEDLLSSVATEADARTQACMIRAVLRRSQQGEAKKTHAQGAVHSLDAAAGATAAAAPVPGAAATTTESKADSKDDSKVDAMPVGNSSAAACPAASASTSPRASSLVPSAPAAGSSCGSLQDEKRPDIAGKLEAAEAFAAKTDIRVTESCRIFVPLILELLDPVTIKRPSPFKTRQAIASALRAVADKRS